MLWIILAVGVVYLMFWGFQLVQLMMLDDGDFPGRYDKILWFVLFCTFVLVAPWVFIAWKRATMSYRLSEKQ